MKVVIEMISTAFILSLALKGGSSEQKNPEDSSSVIISVVYDNNEYDPRLEKAWGFSCLIRGTEKTILFDTGRNGKILLSNMSKLKIDPQEVEVIVLSHIHGDHVGGLDAFLDENSKVTVYLPHSFPDSFKDEVKRYGAEIVSVGKPLKIYQNVYSTGELGTRKKEESLLINTERGLIIITGCAHPGILNVVRRAKEILKTNVHLVMGGFHLRGLSRRQIEEIVQGFKKEGVKKVGPCHCLGNLARKLFKKAYDKDFIPVGVGKIIEIHQFQTSNKSL